MKHDRIKVALAELAFSGVTQAIAMRDLGDDPLHDCLIEPVPINDLELALRVKGPGGTRYFSVKLHEHNKVNQESDK